jgi:hypothetical protein
MEFIFYIFYCCFLTFFFFLVGRTYIVKCQVSYSLSEKRFYNRIFLKHSLYKDLIYLYVSVNLIELCFKSKNRIGQDKKFLTLNFC